MSPGMNPDCIKMRPGLLRVPDGLAENRPGDPLPIGPLVRALTKELDRQQLVWAVLRNAEELPEFTRCDIDMLTLPRCLPEFVRVVESCAKQEGWQIAGRISKHHYTCLMLMKITGAGDVFYLPIDLFTALEYRGAEFLNAEDALRKRVRTEREIWTLPAGASAAIALLKEWLPHGELKESRRAAVRQVAREEPFVTALESAAGREWVERVQRGEWTLSRSDRKSLRNAVRRRHPGWRIGLIKAACSNLCHLFRPSLGRVVCLAGADGSGKTTLAQGLAFRTFKKPFKGARYIHGNIGVLPRFRDIRRRLGFAAAESAPEKETLQGMMDPIPAWKSVLLATYYAVDFFLARLLIRRWRAQWLLTVMDRSFYDYYYQLGHRNCPEWVLNRLSILVPKPDLLLCIEGDAKAIHARKPELTVDEIINEQKILRTLSGRLPFARLLDGAAGAEAMVHSGTEMIFQTLEENPTAGSSGLLSASLTSFQNQKSTFGIPQLRTLAVKGKPLAAVAAGNRAWHLFPATSPRRRLIRDTMRMLSVAGLDRLVCSSRCPGGELLPGGDIETLLARLDGPCGGEIPDWMLSWPAQVERQRMYLVFRTPSGGLSGVIKIGAGEFNRRQLANEADVLSRLAGKELSFSVPSVLFHSELDPNRSALALGGFPARPKPLSPEEADAAGRQVMAAMKQRAGGLTHGDLGAANMLRTEAGGLFVLDWENASDQAPGLTDPVGLWLSARQARVLSAPAEMLTGLQAAFCREPQDELHRALCFLDAHDNLAARKLANAWNKNSI